VGFWDAALAQKYIDAMLPKPKVPRRPKQKPRYFRPSDVSKIVAATESEHRVSIGLRLRQACEQGNLQV